MRAMPPGGDHSRQAAEVAYRMANILAHKGKVDQAITLYQRAINLEPSYVPAYLELETLLKTLGRLDECVGLYRRAVEADPDREIFSARLHELVSAPANRERRHGVRRALETGPRPDDQRSRAHLLIYADSSGISGAEQANHAIATGLRAGGYRVTFVQPEASHHLIEERIAYGIPHIWTGEDDTCIGKRQRRRPCAVRSRARPCSVW